MVKDLPFSIPEFQRRLDLVREEMKRQELDGMLVMSPEDMYWLTGYRSMGIHAYQAIVINHHDEPVAISRKLEEMIFLNNSWTNKFKSYYDNEDPIMLTKEVVEELGLSGKRLGVPMGSNYLNPLEFEKLKQKLGNTTCVDVTFLVARLRWVKSPEEISYMRKAAEITRLGTMAGIDAAREGGSENDIAAAYINTMILNGSERYTTGHPLLGAGPRSAFGHACWENYKLKRGDVVFLEGGGCVRRYHTAAMRTISIGEPTDFVRRLEEASRAGLYAAIDALKPGATSGEVDTACRQAIHKLGMGEYFRHRAGYSIGIGFNTWIDGFSLRPNDQSPIKENMVVHVVPFLSTGDLAVAISETVLVTANGGEKMVNLEHKVFVR